MEKRRKEDGFESSQPVRSLEMAVVMWIFYLARFAPWREMLNDGWFLCPFLPAGRSGWPR